MSNIDPTSLDNHPKFQGRLRRSLNIPAVLVAQTQQIIDAVNPEVDFDVEG
jgi:hypothetical protein